MEKYKFEGLSNAAATPWDALLNDEYEAQRFYERAINLAYNDERAWKEECCATGNDPDDDEARSQWAVEYEGGNNFWDGMDPKVENAYLIVKYPIIGIWNPAYGRCHDIEDIVGMCPACDSTIVATDIRPGGSVSEEDEEFYCGDRKSVV